MTPLISGNYDAEIRELAQRIFSRETKRIKIPELREFVEEEPEIEPVIFPSKEEKVSQRLKKPIKVKSSTRQKEYRKTQPKDFTPREIKFLKSRSVLTGGQVYKEYLDVFGKTRTNRSVKTKFYRVR